jgi:ATP-dependent DNA helicase PIF1
MAEYSEEQAIARELVQGGKSTALHGPAGTGKSKVLRDLVAWAREAYGSNVVAVTATTGAAAVALDIPDAQTLHSWASIGLGKGTAAELAELVRHRRGAPARWRACKVLFIDEISMMSADLFDKLDQVGREIRKRAGEPFGGLQVVVSGDFLQLPPVQSVAEVGAAGGRKFAFEARAWTELFGSEASPGKVVHFRTIWRQADPIFRALLNEIRLGECGPENESILKARVGVAPPADSHIKPTRIFSKRADVATINNEELNKLPGPQQSFKPSWTVERPASRGQVAFPLPQDSPMVRRAMPEITRKLDAADKNAQYETPELCLRVGAQVMCIKNMPLELLVNGSRGVVVDLGGPVPMVEFMDGGVRAMGQMSWDLGELDALPGYHLFRTHVPLRLAWAITTHKSQGTTLDCASVDLGSTVFEAGQAYVAASRVRSLEGLYLTAFNSKKIRADPTVIEWLKAAPGQ